MQAESGGGAEERRGSPGAPAPLGTITPTHRETPMDPANLVQNVVARAEFDPHAMRKLDCFRTDRLFLGLNCFEPGQSQAVHTHADADKFYLVVSGKARMRVGSAVREVGPGALALVPAGVEHGVEGALERTVMVVGMAPAP